MKLTGELDENGKYRQSFLVELEAAHKDQRGFIQMLTNIPVHNVSLIESEPETVRSNHYHKLDWHYIYVLSGVFDYYYKWHDSNQETQCFEVKAGDMIWTPPMEDHATVFKKKTQILALSLMPRDQKAYEADVERVIMVDPVTLNLV